jgi:hypothetical protein
MHTTLTQQVAHPGGTRSIEIQAASHMVRVVLYEALTGKDRAVVNMTWDTLGDMEVLDQAFDLETVRTFKVLIGMLGKLHAEHKAQQAA